MCTALALARADEVYLGAVSRAEKLPESDRFDGPAVARDLEAAGVTAQCFASSAALLDRLQAQTLPPRGAERVVIFFSNGSFDGIIDRFATAAQS